MQCGDEGGNGGDEPSSTDLTPCDEELSCPIEETPGVEGNTDRVCRSYQNGCYCFRDHANLDTMVECEEISTGGGEPTLGEPCDDTMQCTLGDDIQGADRQCRKIVDADGQASQDCYCFRKQGDLASKQKCEAGNTGGGEPTLGEGCGDTMHCTLADSIQGADRECRKIVDADGQASQDCYCFSKAGDFTSKRKCESNSNSDDDWAIGEPCDDTKQCTLGDDVQGADRQCHKLVNAAGQMSEDCFCFSKAGDVRTKQKCESGNTGGGGTTSTDLPPCTQDKACPIGDGSSVSDAADRKCRSYQNGCYCFRDRANLDTKVACEAISTGGPTLGEPCQDSVQCKLDSSLSTADRECHKIVDDNGQASQDCYCFREAGNFATKQKCEAGNTGEPEPCNGECPLESLSTPAEKVPCTDALAGVSGTCDQGTCVVEVNGVTRRCEKAPSCGTGSADQGYFNDGPCTCGCSCEVADRLSACGPRDNGGGGYEPPPPNPCDGEALCEANPELSCKVRDRDTMTSAPAGSINCGCDADGDGKDEPCITPCYGNVVCPKDENADRKCYQRQVAHGSVCQCRDSTQQDQWIDCVPEDTTGDDGEGTVGEPCGTASKCPVGNLRCYDFKAAPLSSADDTVAERSGCFCFPNGLSNVQHRERCHVSQPCGANRFCDADQTIPCTREQIPGTDETQCACRGLNGELKACPEPSLGDLPCAPGNACQAPVKEGEATPPCVKKSITDTECTCEYNRATYPCTGTGTTVKRCPLAYCPDNDATSTAIAGNYERQECVRDEQSGSDDAPCVCEKSRRPCRTLGGGEPAVCGDDIVCSQAATNDDGTLYYPKCEPNEVFGRCMCQVREQGKTQWRNCTAKAQQCDTRLSCPLNVADASTTDKIHCDHTWRTMFNMSSSAVAGAGGGYCKRDPNSREPFCYINGVYCKTTECSDEDVSATSGFVKSCDCGCACVDARTDNLVHQCVDDSSTGGGDDPTTGDDDCDEELVCDAKFDTPILSGGINQKRCGLNVQKGYCDRRKNACMIPHGQDLIECQMKDREFCLQAPSADDQLVECNCDCACFGRRRVNSTIAGSTTTSVLNSNSVSVNAATPMILPPINEGVLYAAECVSASNPTPTGCSPYADLDVNEPCSEKQRRCVHSRDKVCRRTKVGECHPSGGYCIVNGCAACKSPEQCPPTSVLNEAPRNCSCGCACERERELIASLQTPFGETRPLRVIDTCLGADVGAGPCRTDADCKNDLKICHKGLCLLKTTQAVTLGTDNVIPLARSLRIRTSRINFVSKLGGEVFGITESLAANADNEVELNSLLAATFDSIKSNINAFLANVERDEVITVTQVGYTELCAANNFQVVARSIDAFALTVNGERVSLALYDFASASEQRYAATMTSTLCTESRESFDDNLPQCANLNLDATIESGPCLNAQETKKKKKRQSDTSAGVDDVTIRILLDGGAPGSADNVCDKVESDDAVLVKVEESSVEADNGAGDCIDENTQFYNGRVSSLAEATTDGTDQTTAENGEGGLSPLVLAAIAVGACVVLLALMACACFMTRKGKDTNEARASGLHRRSRVTSSTSTRNLNRASSGRSTSRAHLRSSHSRGAVGRSSGAKLNMGGGMPAQNYDSVPQDRMAADTQQMNTLTMNDGVNPLMGGSLRGRADLH